MRQLPTVIKVRYTQPRDYDLKKVPGAIWSYRIKEADGDGVQGFASGLLTKNGFGEWVAHYWDYAVGVPAATRERAILNVLPQAAAFSDKLDADRKDYDRVCLKRRTRAVELNTLFTLFPAECGMVLVRDTTAAMDGPSPEARYKVTFTFDNLTEEQVILLAAKQQKS